jgi:hypothetical protein
MVAAFGVWYTLEHSEKLQEAATSWHKPEFITLEAKYTPEAIMAEQQKNLLPSPLYSFLEPTLHYYPYLLMDIKYLEGQKTGEGAVLWGLEDGEMVINTDNWEKSHGFEDCIRAEATQSDLSLMLAILRKGGSLDRDELIKVLKLDTSDLDRLLQAARQKYLIVEKNHRFFVHIKDPKIDVLPKTRLQQAFVSKPAAQLIAVKARYSQNQVIKIAKATFGADFTVRSKKEVYLPVYSLLVQNPDGSVLRSEWNALTGKRISSTAL